MEAATLFDSVGRDAPQAWEPPSPGHPSDLRIVVYSTPQPAGSKRGFLNKHTGRVAVVDDAKKSRPWKDQVAQEAGRVMAEKELLRGPLEVAFTFYVARPKFHFGKRGLLPSAPPYPAKKPDTLKLARAVEDALQGVVYANDSQIVRELLVKEWGEPERCEIVVRELP